MKFLFFFAAALTWDPLPPESKVVGYDIYYGPNATVPSNHVSVGNVVSAVVPVTGTNYFVVTGRDPDGYVSKPSNQVMLPEATPTPTPIPPVASFALMWNSVQYAHSYRVFENNVQIAELIGLTYSLAGKVGPKSYTVRSVGVSGQSAPSNVVTLPAPPTPTPSPTPVPAVPVLQIVPVQ